MNGSRVLGIALRTCTPRRWTSSGRRDSAFYPVLRHHLRDVEIGADLKRDSYRPYEAGQPVRPDLLVGDCQRAVALRVDQITMPGLSAQAP